MARLAKGVSAARERISRAIRAVRARSTPEQPCPGNSDESIGVSCPKKAMSATTRRLLVRKNRRKSRPATEELMGLKLLKRGCVTMHRIVRRKILGIKLKVLFNKNGTSYGAVSKEMQSYIGVLARTKAPIWRPTWKQVPMERKNKIWQCVQVIY